MSAAAARAIPVVPDTPPPDAILHLATAAWGSQALLSAVELGVFSALGEAGPTDAEALGARLGLQPRLRREFLDALVALGMLARGPDGRYANTPAGARYLDRASPDFWGDALVAAHRRLAPSWARLTQAMVADAPRPEPGDAVADPTAAGPALPEGARGALAGLSRPIGRALAEAFAFARAERVVDIGCGEGCALAEIVHAHPHLEGVGCDLPALRGAFEDYARRRELSARMLFRAGDVFQDRLPRAEVMLLGHPLYGADPGRTRSLLARARAALPKGGALIVHGATIDGARRGNAFGLLASLAAAIETRDGGDGGADCAGWMREAGFRRVTVAPLFGPWSIAVGRA